MSKTIDRIIGIGLMIAGIAIWSIDYFMIKALSSIGYWLAELMNAPTGVGLGIAVWISIACIGILSLVIILGGFVFWMGINFFD